MTARVRVSVHMCSVTFVWVLVKPYSTLSLPSVSLSYFLWSHKVKPQHLWFCWLLMLFPHLLLFPYQPAYDSASSASKLYKTQGKLPQRDATLLFPLLLPLPHRLLFSPFSACHKSKCVPQHWLHVVGVQLKTNSMSSTGRFMSILQCEKKLLH